MCHECRTLTAEAEVLVMLAEAERLVIDAEAARGDSVPGAVRPLNDQEIRAKVRFGDIEGLTNTAVAEATGLLESLREVIVGAILGEMLGDAETVTPAAAGRALAQLNAAQPLPVQTAVARTATALQGVLARVAAGAGALVAGEAKRQGVEVGNWTPPAVDPEVFKVPAATAALHPWQRITGKLQTTVMNPANVYRAEIPRDEVAKELDHIPLDGSTDLAKQTIHSAHGLGRNAAAAQLNPVEIGASEIMDGNTCKPCAAVDGKEYESMEQAMADYPHGGYDACLGGTRCRGTLVFMYDEPEDFDDPNPDPLPPIPAPEPDPEPEPAPAPVKPKRKRTPKPKPVPEPAPAPEPVSPVTPPAKPQTRKEALAQERTKQQAEPATPGLPPAPTATPPKIAKGKTQRYDALNQLPIDHGKATDPPILLARDTNPGFASGTRQYSMNCTSVVQAYEFQRRGYDVKAGPVDDGKGRNASEYVSRWWQDADGRPVQLTRAEDLPLPKEWAQRPRTAPRGTGAMVKAQMDEAIEAMPDGARGFVELVWAKGNSGHVFSWEKVDGKVMYLEGQNGSPASADGHLTPGRFKPSSLRFVRIDDKNPTELITKAFETRPAGMAPVTKVLTSAEKNFKSKWRMRTGPDGKPTYLAPEFRKNKSNRWEPIPEEERARMLEEFLSKGRRNP